MKAPTLTIRQCVEKRPGSLHPSDPRELHFSPGAFFSFSIHATANESDAATIRLPAGVTLRLRSVGVERKQISDFLKSTDGGVKSGGHGVSLKFSSEENGDMLTIWTFDKERSTDHWETGLGLEVSGPRTVRLAAIVDKGFKRGTPLDVHVFGTVKRD